MGEANLPLFRNYLDSLYGVASEFDYSPVDELLEDIKQIFRQKKKLFLCGNGGSGANAVHIANDLLYPTTKTYGAGVRVSALTANSAIVTCLGNDEGYDKIFAYQLGVQADPGDLLVVLSGSGNSNNIIEVVNAARDMNVKSYAILGFDGGKAKSLVDVPIHFPIDDMQISEDLQTIVFHVITKAVYRWYHSENAT